MHKRVHGRRTAFLRSQIETPEINYAHRWTPIKVLRTPNYSNDHMYSRRNVRKYIFALCPTAPFDLGNHKMLQRPGGSRFFQLRCHHGLIALSFNRSFPQVFYFQARIRLVIVYVFFYSTDKSSAINMKCIFYDTAGTIPCRWRQHQRDMENFQFVESAPNNFLERPEY